LQNQHTGQQRIKSSDFPSIKREEKKAARNGKSGQLFFFFCCCCFCFSLSVLQGKKNKKKSEGKWKKENLCVMCSDEKRKVKIKGKYLRNFAARQKKNRGNFLALSLTHSLSLSLLSLSLSLTHRMYF